MGVYSVSGVTAAAPGASANEAIAQLWNPSSAQRIRVLEFHAYRQGAVGTRHVFRRSTARGTPGSTVTPDADNAWMADDDRQSGALLDLAAFSVDPSYAGIIYPTNLSVGTGSDASGLVWVFPDGCVIRPGRGLVFTTTATAASGPWHVTCVWEESGSL